MENNAFRVPHRRVWEREGESGRDGMISRLIRCLAGTAGLLRWLREGL